jgi:asparagine synthetase B (glutamine-hydrolysing)
MQSFFVFTINEHDNECCEGIAIKTKLINWKMNIITVGDISLLCDGHIFKTLKIDPVTDCPEFEIIIWLYKKYGITNALQLLDGVFSFILVDNNVYDEHFKIIVARDIYGIKPMYLMKRSEDVIVFSNDICELKKGVSENATIWKMDGRSKNDSPLKMFRNEMKEHDHFSPGSYTEFHLSSKVFSKWKIEKENHKFYYHKILHKRLNDSSYAITEFTNTIKTNLMKSVKKMCVYLLNKKCKFGCILNENITSSILLTLILEYCSSHTMHLSVEPLKNMQINTYCIGTENSDCIKYNRSIIETFKVQYSNICHKEIIIESKSNEEPTTEYLYENLFMKIKETDSSIAYVFSDLWALEYECNQLMDHSIACTFASECDCDYPSFHSNIDENIIDYECNVKRTLENMHPKLSLINQIGKSHNINVKYPFLDENFIEEYLNVSTQIKKILGK